MKKILIIVLYFSFTIMLYAQACCPVNISFNGTIDAHELSIHKILLPSIQTFKLKDFENSNNSYSDMFVTIKNNDYVGFTQSLGDYCNGFDLENFILSNKYFYVIIETMDKNGNLHLTKKKVDFSETKVEISKPMATIEIPKLSL